jgi:hypothetical protein
MVMKFWRWMDLPDRSPAGESTYGLSAQELPSLMKRLKARQLVPVGLVFTSREMSGKLWENHQVLAYGLAEKDGGVVELKIYDPNFPRDDNCVVRVTPVGKDQQNPGEVSAERINGKGTVKRVRGFFAMPYEPRVPSAKVVAKKPASQSEKPASRSKERPAPAP